MIDSTDGHDGFRPRVVLFDAGGVLILPDGREIAEALRTRLAIEIDPDRIPIAMAQAAYDRDPRWPEPPAVPAEKSFFGSILAHLGVPDHAIGAALDVYRDLHHRPAGIWNAPVAGGRQVVVELRRRGFRTAVVSNSDGRVARHLEDAGYEAALFETIVDSSVVGVAKPDPGIFHVATGVLDVTPEKCLYVGDVNQVDVAGAKAAGIAVVHIDTAGLYGAPDGHWRIREISELLALPPLTPSR